MTVAVLLGVWVTGAVGGVLATHRWHRTRTADAEHRADMCDWFRDVAENRVTELAYAEQHLLRLRDALTRPRKRHIPGATR